MERRSAKQKTLDQVVSSIWAICRRPALFTATSTLPEVVAYVCGVLYYAPPTGDENWSTHAQRFGEYLCARHGSPAKAPLSEAGVIVWALTRAYSDDHVEALWHEFEEFADENLGVPKGTYPVEGGATCGYCTAATNVQKTPKA